MAATLTGGLASFAYFFVDPLDAVALRFAFALIL